MKKFLAVLMAMLMLTAFAGCSEEGLEPSADENVAIKVGNTEFTFNEVNYMYISYFNNVYSNLYNTYGENIASIIDIATPLEDQMFDDTLSWHDYVLEGTVDGLTSLTGLYEAAMAEGFVLPEDYQQSLDSLKEQFESTASEAEMTLDEYVSFMYGEGMDFDSVYSMNEFQYIAAAYAQKFEETISISEEEINAYYAENKDTLDSVTFRYFTNQYSEEEGSLTMEEAKAQAEAVAAVHTVDEFNTLVYEYVPEEMKSYYESGDATLFSNGTPESIGIEEITNWLFEEERQFGETMIYDDERYSGYITVMFIERSPADYNFADVRHILILPEEDEKGNASDEAWANAEKKANEVYAEFLGGDKSEESFAELAKEYSGDGNASKGGIYENVYKGQMVAPFENWCFDAERKPGDSGIVKTQFGYHIMYYIGEGENNLVSLVEPVLAEKVFSEWVIASCEELEIERFDIFETVGGMIDDIINAAKELSEEEQTSEGTGNVTNEEVVSGEG